MNVPHQIQNFAVFHPSFGTARMWGMMNANYGLVSDVTEQYRSSNNTNLILDAWPFNGSKH